MTEPSVDKNSAMYPKIVIGAVCVGFSALVYEVVVAKVLFYFFAESTYSAATVLSVFLLGLALGSFLYGLIEDRIKNNGVFFLFANWMVALYAFFILPKFEFIPELLHLFNFKIGSSFSLLLLYKFIISAGYLIFPTLFLGTMLPFLLTLAVREGKDPGKRISRVYGCDLIGAIAGALISGFFLIPSIGLKATLYLAAVINVMSGLLLLQNQKLQKQILILTVIFCAFVYYITDPWELDRMRNLNKYSGKPPVLNNASPREAVDGSLDSNYEFHAPACEPYPEQGLPFLTRNLFIENSYFGEVHVIEFKICKKSESEEGCIQSPDREEYKVLEIQKRVQCYTRCLKAEVLSEIHFAKYAADISEASDLHVLNIGLGCGLTLATIVDNPKVKKVDIVEINPSIINAAPIFKEETRDVLNNDKVTLINADGFAHVANTNKKYDLIIIDIENPIVVHSSPLYTLEFFEKAAKALDKDHGVFTLWAYQPIERENLDYLSIIYATLNKVFPYIYVKSSGPSSDPYFYSSFQPLNVESLHLDEGDKELNQELKSGLNVPINSLNKQVLQSHWFKDPITGQCN